MRCQCGTLQRSLEKYLAAERKYLLQPVSGETAEDTKANIMRLYRSHTKKADKSGVVRDGPPLRSLGAVEILRHVPKFNGTVTSNDDTPSVVQNDGDEVNRKRVSPCTRRQETV